MKIEDIPHVKFTKQFDDDTQNVGGLHVHWFMPDVEALVKLSKLSGLLEVIFRFIYRAGNEYIRHHLASAWFKSDWRVVNQATNPKPEDVEASKARMSEGYRIDYTLGIKLGEQQGRERTGQKWGKNSKYVPQAKTLVDPELEKDSEEWKAAIIEMCGKIAQATASLKAK